MGNKAWGLGHRVGMAEGIALGRRQAYYSILKGLVIIAPFAISQWQRSRERASEKRRDSTSD